MKNGKISSAVLDRSVLRVLTRAKVRGAWAATGTDGAVLHREEGRDGRHLLVTSVIGSLGGRWDRSVTMLLALALNNLASLGAKGAAVELGVMMSTSSEEGQLREIMTEAAGFCAEHGLEILGGDTQVSPAVCRPVLCVTALGQRAQSRQEADGPPLAQTEGTDGDGKAGRALIMAGYAGCAGTAILARACRGELSERFPSFLTENALGMERQCLMAQAALLAWSQGERIIHDVSSGGVFAALWEMAAREGTGLEVELRKIPIRQETIEICEHLDLNPYQLYGQGALLVAARRPGPLCRALEENGFSASVIGSLTSERRCLIRHGEEVRFLEKPRQDMLWTMEEKEISG